MIRIIRKQVLDLDSLRWGELPVTDLRHVKNEIYRHRKVVEWINDNRIARARYQQKYNKKRKD